MAISEFGGISQGRIAGYNCIYNYQLSQRKNTYYQRIPCKICFFTEHISVFEGFQKEDKSSGANLVQAPDHLLEVLTPETTFVEPLCRTLHRWLDHFSVLDTNKFYIVEFLVQSYISSLQQHYRVIILHTNWIRSAQNGQVKIDLKKKTDLSDLGPIWSNLSLI